MNTLTDARYLYGPTKADVNEFILSSSFNAEVYFMHHIFEERKKPVPREIKIVPSGTLDYNEQLFFANEMAVVEEDAPNHVKVLARYPSPLKPKHLYYVYKDIRRYCGILPKEIVQSLSIWEVSFYYAHGYFQNEDLFARLRAYRPLIEFVRVALPSEASYIVKNICTSCDIHPRVFRDLTMENFMTEEQKNDEFWKDFDMKVWFSKILPPPSRIKEREVSHWREWLA